MFLKPFRTKSNVQLKSSDRKKLQSRIASAFACTDADLQELFSNKASVSFLKIIAHSGDICGVYTVDKLPMFFELPDSAVLLPTVYALWQLPGLVPAFTTHPEVLPRLAKGANLMLPGVIRQGKGRSAYGHCRRDEVVCVNLTSNRAAVGVGQLAHSSDDLYMCGGVGVCVNMVHVFGDKLWSLEESQCLQIPSLGAEIKAPSLEQDFPSLDGKPAPATAPVIVAPKYQPPIEHFPALGGNPQKAPKTIPAAQPAPPSPVRLSEVIVESLTLSDSSEGEATDSDEELPPPEESEDDVLKRAFFTTLKLEGKKLTLPLLTSTFYRCHVVPAADRPIDLKKTSYKKLSKFLADMAAARFITLTEEQKGVDKISAINLEHPDMVEFVAKVAQSDGGNVDGSSGSNLFVTEMTELYLVTDETAKFFARYNLANGQGAEKSQLKKMVKDYVCKSKLQDANNPQLIHCNDLLASMCGGQGAMDIEFDRLFATILSRMKHSFEMRQKSEIKSSKNPTIQMQLATRSGNKKVTLVNNLEAFGIRMAEFEKACKIGVAASTTVTKLANQKGEQLLVQGNQVKFIHKLLTETYKIPSKNIIGMELAKKEKKAKKK